MGNLSTASNKVEVSYDPTFDLDIFKWIIKILKDCEKASSKTIKINGFFSLLMLDGGGSNEGRSTLYAKNIYEASQKNV